MSVEKQQDSVANGDSGANLLVSSATGRWVIAAAVLGSGIAFLDGTVVNVALNALSADLGATASQQQWMLSGYLLTLGSLLVLGGSLGDRYGRRLMFLIGVATFGIASLGCGLAPTAEWLVIARVIQGIAAALLTPGSLAMITAAFAEKERGRAIGAWSGLGGVAGALGPFLGGWLVDNVGWRWVFLINPPIALLAIVLTLRHVPESRDERHHGRLDISGAGLLSVGLGATVYALILGPQDGWSTSAVVSMIAGVSLLVSFFVVEARVKNPMVPLNIFRNMQFSGTNALTFVVYAALSVSLFLVPLRLQQDLGYTALESGAAQMPITLLMLAFASRSGAIAQKIGPRIPLTVGPFVIALAFAMYIRVRPGETYLVSVFPAAVVMGIGLVIMVAPLTTAVLAAIDSNRAGLGSAVSNAVARIAGLLAIAVFPAATGLTVSGSLQTSHGFSTAMISAAVLCFVGGGIGAATIRRQAADRTD